MVWQQWLLAILFAISALLTINNIGKPKKPITPGIATIAVLLNVIMIAIIVSI